MTNGRKTNDRKASNRRANGREVNGRKARGTRAVVGAWALVGVWACLIFFMSAHAGEDLNEGDGLVAQIKNALTCLQAAVLGAGYEDVDLVSPAAHFCEYTVFGALLQNAWRGHVSLRHAAVAAIVCASAYGVTDEFHQLFVPDRACDPLDWVVDTLGATLGACLWHLGGKRSSASA